MNENDINALLDQFVDGLEASESASVIQKINTRPVWSSTYQKISRIFGSLNTLREQNCHQVAPDGLACKTFQKILELENSKKMSGAYIVHKENDSTSSSVLTKSQRTKTQIKHPYLALCVCAGFLMVIMPATWMFLQNRMLAVPAQETAVGQVAVSERVNFIPHTCFAQTGTSKDINTSLFFEQQAMPCSSVAVSNSFGQPYPYTISMTNNEVSLNSRNEVQVTPTHLTTNSKIACPDGHAIFIPKTSGKPIVIESNSLTLPTSLKEPQTLYTDFVTDNISMPVLYQY